MQMNASLFRFRAETLNTGGILGDMVVQYFDCHRTAGAIGQVFIG